MILAIGLLAWLIYKKDTMRSSFLILLAMTVAMYLAGNYIEVSATTLETAKAGLHLRLLAIPFVPTLWFFCVIEFCGIRWKKRWIYGVFLIVPVFFCAALFSWQYNQWFITDVHFVAPGVFGNLDVGPGPYSFIRFAYQNAINLLGVITIIVCFKKGTHRFRKQAVLFLISGLIPLFNTFTHSLYIGNYYVDITPYGLVLSMLAFTIALHYLGVLNSSEVIKARAFTNLPEGILLFDKEGTFVDANIVAHEMFPAMDALPLGASIDEMEYLPFQTKDLQNLEANQKSTSEFSRKHEGVMKIFYVIHSPIFQKNHLIGYSITFNNITPLKKSMQELEEKSTIDQLTGIYNRGYFFNVGERAFQTAQEGKSPFSIVIFDLDHFKKVNDTYGHVFGDYVLKTVAALVKNSLRETDVLARYGGEEFCIMLKATGTNGQNKVEQLRVAIENSLIEDDGIQIKITASFGVAEFSPDDEEFLDLVKRADEQLYLAKEGGRNKVCW